ncbi:MAG: carbohydrate kinase family protein [Gammaproteobacteria bacterium]|nr:carbohydrate kinase family protein [Gammaproteobacteria bacterium]
MATLICGSIAYDTIMVFQDRFRNHILPDQVHILNVSFHVPEMRREFGGCAGNIAYGLDLLGGRPLPMATVGEDFAPYAEWLDSRGIDRRHVTRVPDTYTAQAYITTDLDDNQITAFHPGAMNASHMNRVDQAAGVTLGIVSPDGRQGMIDHAAQFAEAGIPFVLDPGQGLPLFDGPMLLEMIDQARWLTLNDYESRLLLERTGLSLAELARRLDAVVITRGGEGSTIYTGGEEIAVPPVEVATAVDPTGCGDAYRAGLLYGLEQGLDWPTTGRVASLMGALKVAHHGTQNHAFERDEFEDRFREQFGYVLH